MSHDHAPVCDYPPCGRLAVGVLVQPGTDKEVALCLEHRDRALALIEQLNRHHTDHDHDG
jgi:hypothetical protein